MRRWRDRAVAGVAIWATLLGYAWLVGRDSHPLDLAAAVTASLAIAWLFADLVEVAVAPDWSLYHLRSPVRTFDPRFSRLAQELAEASDQRVAALAVHSSIAEIAQQVLRDKYGVDLAQDPEAGRQILGEPTASFLAASPARPKNVMSPQLFDVLTRLESL